MKHGGFRVALPFVRRSMCVLVSLALGPAVACGGESRTTRAQPAGDAGATLDDPVGSVGGGAGEVNGVNTSGTGGSTAGKADTADDDNTAGVGGANGETSGAAGAAGAACGGYDEPCCGGACNDADSVCEIAVADGAKCLRCGVPGAKCCDGNQGAAERCAEGCCVIRGVTAVCVAQGDVCPAGGACDVDGSCGTCGGAGEPCCQEHEEMPIWAAWCAARATCVRDLDTQLLACEACGELGEPCCYDPEDPFALGHCGSTLACNSRDFTPSRCSAAE
jgi:hypothetical protein